MESPEEEELLRSVVLQNAKSIMLARQRAEDELIQAKEALDRKTQELANLLAMTRATLESTTDGILATDHAGKVTGFNQRYVDMWRMPREVIDSKEHRHLLEFCSKQFNTPQDFLAKVDDIYRTSPAVSFDLLELADGRVFERFSRIQVVNERNVGRVWSFHDITERRCAEKALQKQNEWRQVALSSIGDAVITTDMEGRVISLNPVAEDLTGWTQSEAEGVPLERIFQIVNEQTRAPVESPAVKSRRDECRVGLADHTVLIAKDGTERPIDDSAAPIKDQHGNILGVVLVFRDVTERRRAEELQLHLAAVVAASDDAIVSKNLDGIIRTWNAGAERIFGYTAAEAVGQSIGLIIPPDRQEEERSILERLRRGERIDHFETVRVSKQGRHIDISLTVSPVRDSTGRIVGASKIARDITDRKRADDALRQSVQQFRQLANALPQIVWTARPDGFIDYYNERWYEFTGFKRDDYGDQSWKPILHPDDVQRCADTYYGCIHSGQLYRIEYRFKDRRTGGYRWFLGQAYPVRDEDGEVVRWFGTCTDIDETKRAEETARFLADASAALAELTDYQSTLQTVAALAIPFFADWCAVDILEADGSIRRLAVTHSDPAKVELAHEMLRRFPPQPSDPHGVMKVLRTGESEWMPMISDSMLVARAKGDDNLRIMRQLGMKSYVCVPLRSRDRVMGALTFVTAESGRVYAASDLAAAEELTRRAAIAIENANLLSELKEEDRRKDEFLAVLAHELRNPLAPICNAVEIMRTQGPSLPEVQWARDVIERQAEHMTRLIDDLLDVSRVTRGKIELRTERIELGAAMNQAVDAARSLAQCKQHELTLALPPQPIYVNADRTRLAQIVGNLLNNACKFMDHGGRIWLAVSREGEQAVIRVKDKGIGIAAEHLPRIFNMFAQLDSPLQRSQSGLGIGLALARQLVELHGGTIEAFSDGPGKGSEFLVRLRVADASAAIARPATGADDEAAHSKKLRILVVDDNRDAADGLGKLLRKIGNEVHTAYDGLQAVAAASTFLPNVVILDIGLPKLNGYEVGRRIRDELGKDVILIAVTGWGQENDRRRSKESGFDHHMTKPVEFAVLKKLLASLELPKN